MGYDKIYYIEKPGFTYSNIFCGNYLKHIVDKLSEPLKTLISQASKSCARKHGKKYRPYRLVTKFKHPSSVGKYDVYIALLQELLDPSEWVFIDFEGLTTKNKKDAIIYTFKRGYK